MRISSMEHEKIHCVLQMCLWDHTNRRVNGRFYSAPFSNAATPTDDCGEILVKQFQI